MTPRGIQIDAINRGLLDGQSIMVCSPTGSGKTMVGEMALLRSVMNGKRGLYLVPLRALAQQVAEGLIERYNPHGLSIGITTGDYQSQGEELGDHDIIVTTYERADSLLRHKTSWIGDIGTIVVDEIQTLSEPERGARLEGLILRLMKRLDDVQIVALSATTGSPDMLAEWLHCDLIQSDKRPVPLTCHVFRTKDRKRSIQEFVMTTVQANGQALVFTRTRSNAEATASDLAHKSGKQLTSKERDALDAEMDSVENWNVTIPSKLRKFLHDGVAFHHAGLNASTRRLVERLFRRGLIRVICATTTLAAGMDLPARTVVVSNIRSPADFKQYLPVNQVHQMLGRAGRPGKDKTGFGVILTDSQSEADMVKVQYFTTIKEQDSEKESLAPRYLPVVSVLSDSNALAEQLLVSIDWLGEATIEELEQDVFGNSFLVHLGIRDTKSPMRLITLGEITAESSIEKHALSTTVRAGREGVLGTVKLREVSDTVIGGIVSSLGGGHHTCRFSIRVDANGMIEGPMCSCGTALSKGRLLCTHLVALGLTSIKQVRSNADYVIPLALSETSPLGMLVRLGLVEGGKDNRLRPTLLGRIVTRLYLKISTLREMLPLLSVVETTSGLLSLLKHLISLESPHMVGDDFENILLTTATTNIDLEDIARSNSQHIGDVLSLLDQCRWLLYCITAVADVGGLEKPQEMAERLLKDLETRLIDKQDGVNDDIS